MLDGSTSVTMEQCGDIPVQITKKALDREDEKERKPLKSSCLCLFFMRFTDKVNDNIITQWVHNNQCFCCSCRSSQFIQSTLFIAPTKQSSNYSLQQLYKEKHFDNDNYTYISTVTYV